MSTGRFSVSQLGMWELNIGREPWDLIKELIQNAWDEVPSTTECRVTVEPRPDENATKISVEDDGPGFRDITDAYTIMGPTYKRLDPIKRGRFNIGEKDVISVAIEAEVETVGHTVTFPRTGSRVESSNSRENGTVVRVLMPWDEEKSKELVTMLQRFLPPVNCGLFVNDRQIPPRPAKEVRTVNGLPTEKQDAPNQPIKRINRRTEIYLVEPNDPKGECWLYEMGIPVQTIDCPWDIDVMQKIPMGQQRNAVSESYLNRIYAEVLNAGHKTLAREEFRSQWVKRAIEQRLHIERQAVDATREGRYGRDKSVLGTLDSDANMRSHEAGYSVIDPGGLSKREIEVFRMHAGVKNSDEVFPTPPPPRSDYEAKPNTNQARFADWVVEVAGHCGLKATVRYFNEPHNTMQADCNVSTTTPLLRFNEAHLGKKFFQPPYGSFEHWNLLLHEFGHAVADQSVIGHGEIWGEGVSKAGALIAAHLLRNKAE